MFVFDGGPIGPTAEDSFACWLWTNNKSPFLDWRYVGQRKSVMDKNPPFRPFVANGYFDTQSGFPQGRFETHYYRSDHMRYPVEASLGAFHRRGPAVCAACRRWYQRTMTRRPFSRLLIALCGVAAALTAAPAAAQGLPSAPGIMARRSQLPMSLADMPASRSFVTHHRILINGRAVAYRATAGDTYVTNIYDEPVARFFSFDYVKEAPGDPARPVLFAFNGGPGAASLWLQMGILGPRRVVLSPDVNPANTPPFGLVANPDSLLDVADLVFIDPVGTGFSHAVGNAADLDFASVDVDADSVARFIELWLSKNGRWNSAKYLLGESYGTIRAAVLTRALMGGPLYTGVMRGITVNGVILIGPSLNVGRAAGPPPTGPDPSDGDALASMAVTAWYHNRIDRAGRSAAQVYAEAKAFGEGDYATALWKQKQGSLDDAAKRAVATRLSALTGLSADTWISAGLTISIHDYLKRVLAGAGEEAGVYDSRYTLPLTDSGGDPVSDDPAMARYVPGFVAAFHMMLRDDLKVDLPVPYTAIGWGALNLSWSYKRTGIGEDKGFATDLAIAMRRNPALRVMVAAGYYDMLATPVSGEAQVREAGLPVERVVLRTYESGHMVYLGGTASHFASDVRAFVRGEKPRGDRQ